MTRKCILATSQLNQWVLDYDNNRNRIIEAIKTAKSKGASLILTPELCITGYGLLDHFLEKDHFDHSWDVVAEIVVHPDCQDIIIDLGLPVKHRDVAFNARVIALNGEVLAIRPKLDLCNDGNYREMRYFSAWPRSRAPEDYNLPEVISKLPRKQRHTRIGEVVFETNDNASFASETCEELWTPDSPHSLYSLAGIEIVLNSSGSHHELRKLDTRINLIKEATARTGGVYMYSNQRGCDGDRVYYDGCALILNSGHVLKQGPQFTLRDVEVVTATVDLDEIWAFRTSKSRGMQANDPKVHKLERIKVPFDLVPGRKHLLSKLTPAMQEKYHLPEEEIAYSPACWMWDYLRRSKAAGFLVPLSGGIDSCATATIVFSMCRMVVAAIKEGNQTVIDDATRLCNGQDVKTMTAEQICNSIFTTTFMGMKEQSSVETRTRASQLAKAIGSNHIDTNIDPMVSALRTLVGDILQKQPQFKVHGGSNTENLALQNFQSRSRMVLAYALGQLVPWSLNKPGGLLILGSANVDECLRGYLTKYDCSSADINPIGGISKTDLKRFIRWAQEDFELPILGEFLDAVPTAELEPITETYVQSDEADMGFTYDQLSTLGRYRKTFKLGTVGMFERLVVEWGESPHDMTPRQVYEKVRSFHYYYAINRHKMTTMTPGLYLESYTPDDNRFDLRPFLYPTFTFEHRKIERMLEEMERGGEVVGKEESNDKEEVD